MLANVCILVAITVLCVKSIVCSTVYYRTDRYRVDNRFVYQFYALIGIKCKGQLC